MMKCMNKKKDCSVEKTILWKVALYIRLSKEDGHDESYSVKNQRQRLNTFFEKLSLQEKALLWETYIDDGYTGTDSQRNHFQRMLVDIEKGIVNCVVVKDLSRLSRNDWECKKYLQHLFVIKNVRFISLELPMLDSYKRPDEVYDMGVSIQSMYNENHCRETSVKVRGTLDMKRKRGEFIGAFAPYGYFKDPKDKHHLVVDNEAAAIVKNIFYWFVREGRSKNRIAKTLTEMGVPCPTAYKWQNGMQYYNPAISGSEPLWSVRSITAILTNQMYLGHMVQGKQRVKSYKIHTRINLPESEWFITENTHEAIVDQMIFDKAQELMQIHTRTSPQSEKLYIFSGFLRCADCGKAMGRRTSKNLVYYACKTNTTLGLCTRHSIREDKLQRIVLEILQKQISLIGDMDQLTDDLRGLPQVPVISGMLTSSLELKKRKLEKSSNLKSGLYIDWKNGDITRDEYHQMKEEFEQKEKYLTAEIQGLEEEIKEAANSTVPCNDTFERFLEYKNIWELNRGIVTELVKTIYVHEDGEITIDLDFTDPYHIL